MTPITKRNLIIAALLFFSFTLGGGTGYTVAQSSECPSEHTVRIDAPPAEVTCKVDPCVCHCVVSVEGAESGQDCPEIKIEPAGHYLGPAAGWADGALLGASYSYVRPKWALEATVAHRWADSEVWTPPRYDYRSWRPAPVRIPGDDGIVVMASWKRRLP